MPVIATPTSAPPRISTEQMIEVDRLMIKSYSIELKQMMENAGRALAIVARERFLLGSLVGKRVIVMAGTGGNGGGALVAARRLRNWGADVEVVLTANPAQYSAVGGHQLRIVQEMQVPIWSVADFKMELPADLLVDGIIGYSLKGDPRGDAKILIEWANEQRIPILSLDTPSGLDLTSGIVHTPCIKADATLTLALPKQGLYLEHARAKVGGLYLADISVPPQLYEQLGIALDEVAGIFAESDIVVLNTGL